MNIVIKIILAIIAFVAVFKFVQPHLIGWMPPFGMLLVVVIYLAIIGWLLAYSY